MSEVEEKKLTPEARKKLLEAGALGFVENKEFEYVPKVYREKDKETGEYLIPKSLWPVFKLKAKDGIEASKLENNSGYFEYSEDNKTKKFISRSGTFRIQVLQDGIIGWKNFHDSSGNIIEYREHGPGKIHKDVLGRISTKLQVELMDAIIERTQLTDEELEGLDY